MFLTKNTNIVCFIAIMVKAIFALNLKHGLRIVLIFVASEISMVLTI